MRISDIQGRINLKPLKLSVRETPHLTIETNLTCNIRCRGCYNLYKTYVKPLSQIKAEIDLALLKRNLETITLLGGEPTLHPDLVEIIRYVKNKNVICEMLTNGVVFLEDKDDSRLDEVVAAGLDRIVLHVDVGQSHIHGDINRVRHALFEKFERRKLFFSLSTTIYQDNRGKIPSFMKEYARYRYFDGILSILEMGTPHNFSAGYKPGCGPRLYDEYQAISKELEISPSAFIPSSLDDERISWLMFFYYINTETRETMDISPEYNRLFRKIYRLLTGRHVFGMTSRPWLFPYSFLLTCLVEVLFHPRKIWRIGNLLKKSRWLRSLRFHYILIQRGPEYDSKRDQLQMCYHCPDATIRGGKLTPVCAADLISPYNNDGLPKDINQELSQTIYAHLEQI